MSWLHTKVLLKPLVSLYELQCDVSVMRSAFVRADPTYQLNAEETE